MVHKANGCHSWRALINEVGVIVLGVSIGERAGEQTVEALALARQGRLMRAREAVIIRPNSMKTSATR